jgi:hypothetical protein
MHRAVVSCRGGRKRQWQCREEVKPMQQIGQHSLVRAQRAKDGRPPSTLLLGLRSHTPKPRSLSPPLPPSFPSSGDPPIYSRSHTHWLPSGEHEPLKHCWPWQFRGEPWLHMSCACCGVGQLREVPASLTGRKPPSRTVVPAGGAEGRVWAGERGESKSRRERGGGRSSEQGAGEGIGVSARSGCLPRLPSCAAPRWLLR